jgi:hypothetical protein
MTHRPGYVERSNSILVLYGRIRPTLQKESHNVDMAHKRRLVQRRVAVFILGVWIGAVLQEKLDYLGMGIIRCLV